MLDEQFGLPHKTTLSQRDVPGMTRGVVPLLSELNVSGLLGGLLLFLLFLLFCILYIA